jgi:hypothetical protein
MKRTRHKPEQIIRKLRTGTYQGSCPLGVLS